MYFLGFGMIAIEFSAPENPYNDEIIDIQAYLVHFLWQKSIFWSKLAIFGHFGLFSDVEKDPKIGPQGTPDELL